MRSFATVSRRCIQSQSKFDSVKALQYTEAIYSTLIELQKDLATEKTLFSCNRQLIHRYTQGSFAKEPFQIMSKKQQMQILFITKQCSLARTNKNGFDESICE